MTVVKSLARNKTLPACKLFSSCRVDDLVYFAGTAACIFSRLLQTDLHDLSSLVKKGQSNAETNAWQQCICNLEALVTVKLVYSAKSMLT